jgi:hypothetical protein
MALTMQNIVDGARLPLNDSDPSDANRRWPDPELLKYARDGVLLLRDKRPDLFFEGLEAEFSALALGSTFPLPEDYAPSVQDYATARAHFKDEEAAVEGAASSFFSLFKVGAMD